MPCAGGCRQKRAGTLFVVGTPIGNLEDITARARAVLAAVPAIACEDTRKTGLLLKRLGLENPKRRFIAYHEHNEFAATRKVLAVLRCGMDVALVTNAGTPLISDPGYRLVSAARAEGIVVAPIPGPCAVVAALSASGLPTDRFTFFGFVPAKASRRAALWREIESSRGTCIFFVPARLVEKVLMELREVNRAAKVVIAREMTKKFEEFIAGTPEECLAQWAQGKGRGEVTLLVNIG